MECLGCGCHLLASLRSCCQAGVLGQEFIDTTLAWSKDGLQTKKNQLGHQRWECLVQAQLAHLTSRHSRCFLPGISFSKRGLGKALMGGPVSTRSHVCLTLCPGHSGILLLLPFLGIVKDDGFSNSKSFSHGIGQENWPGNRINLPKFGIYVTWMNLCVARSRLDKSLHNSWSPFPCNFMWMSCAHCKRRLESDSHGTQGS